MVAQGSLPKHLHTSDQDGVEPKRNGLDQQQADAIVQLGQALHFTIRLLLPGFANSKACLQSCLGQGKNILEAENLLMFDRGGISTVYYSLRRHTSVQDAVLLDLVENSGQICLCPGLFFVVTAVAIF